MHTHHDSLTTVQLVAAEEFTCRFLHPLQVRLGRLVAARGLDVRLGGSPQHATLGHNLRSLL
jgi:hypothetical protein